MNTCPKCGSTFIIGPKYVRDFSTGREGMLYVCGTCGYREMGRTLDAVTKELAMQLKPKP